MTLGLSRRATPSRVLLILLAVLTALLIVLPIAIVIPMSTTEDRLLSFPPRGFTLEWYATVLTSPRWTDRLFASLQVAVATAIVATTLGTMTAVGLMRSRMRRKSLVYGLVLAPLIVPTVVVGVGLYFLMVRGWVLGPLSVGGGLTGSALGLVLAHSVLAFPYPVITVVTSLATVDRNLELAASSLGASPISTFRRVTFPLILPGVIAGLLFSFLTSWDEAVIASFLASPRFSTIPVELFGQVRLGVDPSAAAVSTLLMGVSAVILFAMLMLRRQGDGT
jgi:putative spermidine/putrescine transport system permease protein